MTDLLREVLLSLADPPAAEAPPLADLEWRQRRRRRRRVTGRASAVGVCLVVLVGGVVSLDRSPDGSQPAAAPPDVAFTVAPPTSPSTTAVADPSTCRNSYNASCGPFRWEPTPPEYPITVDVTYEPADPRVGETVTFTVTAQRGAGSALARVVESGDGGSPMADTQFSCGGPAYSPRYGPWDLPSAAPYSHTTRYTWTYRSAGTYTARFSFEHWFCGNAPVYPGRGEASVTVTIQR